MRKKKDKMTAPATQSDVEAQAGQQVQEKQPDAPAAPSTQEPTTVNRGAPLPLPPSHQKVRFDQESQVIPPQQYAQYAQSEPVQYPYSHKWHIAKLVLYHSAIVISIIIFALGIYAASSSFYRGEADFAFTAAAAGASVTWTAVEFLVMCVSRKDPQRGVHPGAHVAVHLVIWLYCVVVATFLGIFIGYGDYYYSYLSQYYEFPPVIDQVLLAMIIILLLLHFTLFVRACVETHQFNNTPSQTTIYVPVAMEVNGAYGSPYGYYAQQPPQALAIPPEIARQMAAPGQLPMMPQQTLLQGYYAPPGQTQMPPTAAQHAAQANQTAIYGYYAPTPSARQPAPTRGAMRQPTPAGSVSTAGPGSRTPNSPPAPSPVSEPADLSRV